MAGDATGGWGSSTTTTVGSTTTSTMLIQMTPASIPTPLKDSGENSSVGCHHLENVELVKDNNSTETLRKSMERMGKVEDAQGGEYVSEEEVLLEKQAQEKTATRNILNAFTSLTASFARQSS